jgi:uncharacterized protein (DUF952 family)
VSLMEKSETSSSGCRRDFAIVILWHKSLLAFCGYGMPCRVQGATWSCHVRDDVVGRGSIAVFRDAAEMPIFKVCDATAWRTAMVDGQYGGSADDVRDGYIHLSTAAQIPGTLAKYFSAREDLVIASVDEAVLGENLRWEASRGGMLFPHIYGVLPMAAVLWWMPLALGPNGVHVLPREVV